MTRPERALGIAMAFVALASCAALPLDAQDRLGPARAAFMRGQADSAMALLKRQAEAEPDRAEVHFWLARIAGAEAAQRSWIRGIGVSRTAKSAASRALALEPDNPDYLELHTTLLSALPGILGGNRDSALALAMRLHGVDPARGARTALAVLERGDNGWRARNDSIVETIRRGTAGDRTTQLVIAAYCADRCPERALAIHEQLVERDSLDAFARYWAARALVILEREPRRAQSYLWPVARGRRRPLDFSPSFAVIVAGAPWWRLGHTYVQLGMPDSARICFEEVLKVASDTSMVRAARAALDSLSWRSSGREDDAAALSEAGPADELSHPRGTR